MIHHLLFSYINYLFINLLFYVRYFIQIASQEDEYHVIKKDRSCFMYVHLVSSSKEKYDNLLSGILSTKLVFLLEKYNITMEELINDESHILNLHYKYPNIIIGINHYYVGGTDYLSLLLELYEATNVKFPKTNFLKSVYLKY